MNTRGGIWGWVAINAEAKLRRLGADKGGSNGKKRRKRSAADGEAKGSSSPAEAVLVNKFISTAH